jgi:hypothetical protein
MGFGLCDGIDLPEAWNWDRWDLVDIFRDFRVLKLWEKSRNWRSLLEFLMFLLKLYGFCFFNLILLNVGVI